jgi:hypothetical protein
MVSSVIVSDRNASAGRGVVDRLHVAHHQARSGQRDQRRLRVVLQIDGDVTTSDGGYHLGNQRSDELRRHLVCALDHVKFVDIDQSFIIFWFVQSIGFVGLFWD